MFKDKKTAICYLHSFQGLSAQIAETVSLVEATADESELSQAQAIAGQMLSKIMVEVYYPIIAVHPELRLPELLGKLREDAAYVLFKAHTHENDCEIVMSNVQPDEVYPGLERLRKNEGALDYIYWAELMPRQEALSKEPSQGAGG